MADTVLCVLNTHEHSVKRTVCSCKLFNYLPEASTCDCTTTHKASTNVCHTLPNAGHALRFESAIAPRPTHASLRDRCMRSHDSARSPSALSASRRELQIAEPLSTTSSLRAPPPVLCVVVYPRTSSHIHGHYPSHVLSAGKLCVDARYPIRLLRARRVRPRQWPQDLRLVQY